jgi:hypothetical protein
MAPVVLAADGEPVQEGGSEDHGAQDGRHHEHYGLRYHPETQQREHEARQGAEGEEDEKERDAQQLADERHRCQHGPEDHVEAVQEASF